MPSDAGDEWNRPPGEAEAVAGTGLGNYNERDFHDSHTGEPPHPHRVGSANAAWLETQDRDLRTVVAVERIRDENPGVYACLMRHTDDDVAVRVLRALIARNGATTYDDIEDFVPDVTGRTVRSRVASLRDGGVLDVGEGRPAGIGFVDRDAALLAEDTLSYLE